MNVLVTGAAGYIGSQLCLKLLKEGYKVIGVDIGENKPTKIMSEKYNESFHMYFFDIRNKEKLDLIFKNNEISLVYHCAANKSVYESFAYPIRYYDNNINGTLSLLSSMVKNDVGNIIFCSSASVYGEQENKISENNDTKANSPYAKTKLWVEFILEDLFNIGKISYISLRIFNPIGVIKEFNYGFFEKSLEKTVYGQFYSNCKKNMLLNIYGNSYNTKDGTPVRDFIDINDLNDLFILAGEYIIKNSNENMIINVGSGKATSMLKLAKNMIKISHSKSKINIQEKKVNDIPYSLANIEKAHDIFGWVPKNNLDESIYSIIYSKNYNFWK